MSYQQGYSFKDVLRSFVDSNYVQDSEAENPPLVMLLDGDASNDTNPPATDEKVKNIEPEAMSDDSPKTKLETQSDNESNDNSADENTPTQNEIPDIKPPETEPTKPETPDKEPESVQDVAAKIIKQNPQPQNTAHNTETMTEKTLDEKIKISKEEMESLAEKANECQDVEDLDDSDDKVNIGSKLIASGLLTHWQRFIIVSHQRKLYEEGIDIRFGELAVKLGYCKAEDIEDVMGKKGGLRPKVIGEAGAVTNAAWMGSRLITAGFITSSQRDMLVEEQKKLSTRGENIRIGELAVMHNFCTEKQIECLIDQRTNMLADCKW